MSQPHYWHIVTGVGNRLNIKIPSNPAFPASYVHTGFSPSGERYTLDSGSVRRGAIEELISEKIGTIHTEAIRVFGFQFRIEPKDEPTSRAVLTERSTRTDGGSVTHKTKFYPTSEIRKKIKAFEEKFCSNLFESKEILEKSLLVA